MQPEKIAHLLTAEEAFWLNPCDRWELVDGRVVEMSPTKKDDQIEDPALLPGLKLQVAALFSD